MKLQSLEFGRDLQNSLVASDIENEYHFQISTSSEFSFMPPTIASTAVSFVVWLSLAVAVPYAHAADEVNDDQSTARAEETHNEEVVVTATRTESQQGKSIVATQVISRSEIETSGASTVADLFSAQAGVSLERSFAGTAIRLQGLNPEHVLVLIDGQRVVGRKNGAIDLDRYPVDWIERVEIVKGPSSVLYGSDAMGGVINIITRRADGPLSADLYGSYGMPEALDTSASISTQQGGVGSRVHGGYHTTSGYDLDPATLATNAPAREMFHAGSISDIELSPDWRITPRVAYRQQDSRGVSESGSGAVFDDRNLSEEVQGALLSDTLISKDARLRVTGFATWYRDQFYSNQRDSDALDSYQDTQEFLVQGVVQYDHALGQAHLATAGVDVLAEQMDSDRLEAGDGDRERVGVFAQDQWTLPWDQRLSLLPGFRVDLDSQFGVYPTPRLALRFEASQAVVLRAGLGWGYRAPSFKELLLRFENTSAGYVVEGSPDLSPETSRNVNLGLDWNVSDALWMSISGYRNDVRDLIGFGTLEDGIAGSPTRFAYINIAEAVTQGGEASINSDPIEGLSVGASYALTATLDVQNDRPLEGRPLHQVSGRVHQEFAAWGTSFTARGIWNGPRHYFEDRNGDGLEDQITTNPSTVVDVRMSQDLDLKGVGLRLFVGAENVMDTGDAEYLLLAPRTIYAGLIGRYSAQK